MQEELKSVTFANEAEEASWCESHEDALLDEFEKAGAEGRLGIGTVVARLRVSRASQVNGGQGSPESGD
jgi:hypothetical protein